MQRIFLEREREREFGERAEVGEIHSLSVPDYGVVQLTLNSEVSYMLFEISVTIFSMTSLKQ